MRAAAVFLLAALVLAGCREEAGPRPAPLPPNPLEVTTRDCERTGGRMVKAGIANAMTCIHETSDSGKQCRRSGECEGDCLARSGTCSPVRPLFGCNEILMDDGRRATLCRD